MPLTNPSLIELQSHAGDGHTERVTAVPQQPDASDAATPSSSLNSHQRSLTQADVDALCKAAQNAWKHTSPRQRTVVFRWRGQLYRSRWTNFRMLVDTINGEAMVCVWRK